MTAARTVKEIKTVFGRTFIVESVDFAAVKTAMQSLPVCAPSGGQARLNLGGKMGYAAIPCPPSGRQAQATPAATAKPLARTDWKPTGLVIDYIANIAGTITTNIVFAADTTYFVMGTVTCNGAVTIEPAVFRYHAGTSIQLNNGVTRKTSQYRPAILGRGR